MIINSVSGGGGGGGSGIPKCRHITQNTSSSTSTVIGIRYDVSIYTPGTYYIFASYIVQRGTTRVTQMAVTFPKSDYINDPTEAHAELTMLATDGTNYYPAIKAKVKTPATIAQSTLRIPTYTVNTGSATKYMLADIYIMTFDGEVDNIQTYTTWQS